MDDARLPFVAAAPTLSAKRELSANPIALRLLLQPSGFCIEVSKLEMVLGRHSEADIRLTLPDISRRHCRFVFQRGQWQVFDLHSLNGVFVNGDRVSAATLATDDLLGIGGLIFKVQLADAQREGDIAILPGPMARTEQRKAS